jgi:hypothetical protein
VDRKDLEDLLADAEARRAEIEARINDLKRQLGQPLASYTLANDGGGPQPSAETAPNEAEDLRERSDHRQTLKGRAPQGDDPEEEIAAEIEDLLADPEGVHSP